MFIHLRGRHLGHFFFIFPLPHSRFFLPHPPFTLPSLPPTLGSSSSPPQHLATTTSPPQSRAATTAHCTEKWQQQQPRNRSGTDLFFPSSLAGLDHTKQALGVPLLGRIRAPKWAGVHSLIHLTGCPVLGCQILSVFSSIEVSSCLS